MLKRGKVLDSLENFLVDVTRGEHDDPKAEAPFCDESTADVGWFESDQA